MWWSVRPAPRLRLEILAVDASPSPQQFAVKHLAAMPREAEPSNNERAFILEALRESIRLDGRALNAYRNIELSFGDEDGVADVQLGKTRYAYSIPISRRNYPDRHPESSPASPPR